jgi:uncharacterized protein YgiM (DUF1202 family)
MTPLFARSTVLSTSHLLLRRLAAGVVVFSVAASLSLCRADPTPDAPPAGFDNAQNMVGGIINTDQVFVRCGAADSCYPTMRLDKGAHVNVVGMKMDWLKITPPDGSFCYILKVFVDRNGDGTAGKVNKDSVNVRAGSTLNTLKVQVACQLSVGDEVKILGEQDEYFKIAPPEAKAFAYVKKQFVDPDPNSAPQPLQPVAQVDAPKAPNAPKATDNGTEQQTSPPPITNVEAVKDTTATTQSVAEATTPTTKATDPAALVGAKFDEAEAAYTASNSKPLDQQPIADLIKQYETLAASDQLPSTLHRIADTRLATLKLRSQAATELANAKAAQEAMQKKQTALQAERKELEERGQALDVAVYTAVGDLQTSSLQLGNKMLYRLTDPANGRTVCYLRSDDSKYVNFLGKFIGVKGELTTEAQLSLKVITPNDVSEVDPSQVNHGVTATVVPPSMIAPDDASAAAHVDTQK